MRRAPVQRWPHFSVISLPTSLMKRSNSSVPGVASGPSTMALRLSASMLKGTLSSTMRGCFFSMRPVVALPVKVTTSWCITLSSNPSALPTMSWIAPSGTMPLATMSFTIASVR